MTKTKYDIINKISIYSYILALILTFINQHTTAAGYVLFLLIILPYSLYHKIITFQEVKTTLSQKKSLLLLMIYFWIFLSLIWLPSNHILAAVEAPSRIIIIGTSLLLIFKILNKTSEFDIHIYIPLINKIVILIMVLATISIIDIYYLHGKISSMILNQKELSYRSFFWYEHSQILWLGTLGSIYIWNVQNNQSKLPLILTVIVTFSSIILNKYYTGYVAIIFATLITLICAILPRIISFWLIVIINFCYIFLSPMIISVFIIILNKYHIKLSNSLISRVHLWDLLITKIKSAPLIGQGVNLFKALKNNSVTHPADYTNIASSYTHPTNGFYFKFLSDYYHGHNFPLQILFELGYVGGILFFLLNLVVIKYIFKKEHSKHIILGAVFNYFVLIIISYGSYGLWEISFLTIIVLIAIFSYHIINMANSKSKEAFSQDK